MITKYLQAALRHAFYEILSDDGHSMAKSPSVMACTLAPLR